MTSSWRRGSRENIISLPYTRFSFRKRLRLIICRSFRWYRHLDHYQLKLSVRSDTSLKFSQDLDKIRDNSEKDVIRQGCQETTNGRSSLLRMESAQNGKQVLNLTLMFSTKSTTVGKSRLQTLTQGQLMLLELKVEFNIFWMEEARNQLKVTWWQPTCLWARLLKENKISSPSGRQEGNRAKWKQEIELTLSAWEKIIWVILATRSLFHFTDAEW